MKEIENVKEVFRVKGELYGFSGGGLLVDQPAGESRVGGSGFVIGRAEGDGGVAFLE